MVVLVLGGRGKNFVEIEERKKVLRVF